MDVFRKFNEEKQKNWLKGVVGLRLLQNPLECFIDEQVDIFHQALRRECGSGVCDNECHFKNWKPRPNQFLLHNLHHKTAEILWELLTFHDQVPTLDCEVCSRWRDVIWANHNSKGGKVMWMNSEPHLWSQDKWEVAKVYMTGGHKNHKSIGQFDIVALLSLMTQCNHFKEFKLGGLCEQVANVRNNIMHSPNYELKREELNGYLGRIRALGEVLAEHDPVFKYLSEDIDKIQNLDFRLNFPDTMAEEEIPIHEKELEDKLFAAVTLVEENYNTQVSLRRKMKKLEQRLAECYSLFHPAKHRRQQQQMAHLDRPNRRSAPVEMDTGPHAQAPINLDERIQLGAALPMALGFVAVIFMAVLSLL